MKFQFILENGGKQEIAVPEDVKVYRAILYVKDGKYITIGIPDNIQKVYISE